MSKKRMQTILNYTKNSFPWDVVVLYDLSMSILLEV